MFLQPLALPRAGHGVFERQESIVCTEYRVKNCLGCAQLQVSASIAQPSKTPKPFFLGLWPPKIMQNGMCKACFTLCSCIFHPSGHCVLGGGKSNAWCTDCFSSFQPQQLEKF